MEAKPVKYASSLLLLSSQSELETRLLQRKDELLTTLSIQLFSSIRHPRIGIPEFTSHKRVIGVKT